jgi:hypothetical protein
LQDFNLAKVSFLNFKKIYFVNKVFRFLLFVNGSV